MKLKLSDLGIHLTEDEYSCLRRLLYEVFDWDDKVGEIEDEVYKAIVKYMKDYKLSFNSKVQKYEEIPVDLMLIIIDTYRMSMGDCNSILFGLKSRINAKMKP